jgi:hypothetical protein
MPTRNGIPMAAPPTDGAPGWIGPLHPYNWLDIGASETAGLQQADVMRGQPPALAWWQQRIVPGPRSMPQAVPVYLTSRPYSRGAEAHAPIFGQLAWNPIGAGVVAPYRLPSIAGPGARYEFGAIWFDVQAIPTGIRMNPTIPIETVDALMATAHVGPAYVTSG